MDDLIKDFLSEANESIEALDRALVRFEREPEDPELLSEIFRVMHTIKGTCGFLGLPRLAGIAHASENVLGQFRDGSLKPTQDSVSAILDSVDLIKQLLVDLEASGAEAPGDDSALVRRLKEVAQAGDHGAAASPVIDPLKDRIGGLSSLDCAVESALGKARASPAGIKLHGIQEEALHAAIRDAVWSGIEGSGEKSLASTLAAFGLADEAALVIA
jgi:two-component system chemotaxis sensor kinase CheA